MTAIKNKITIILLLSLAVTGNAQLKDSLSLAQNQDKLSYKQFIAPAALITGGVLLMNIDWRALAAQKNA